MENILIFASHLNKSFGSNRAVADISLQVQAGQIYGLVGPDGAGKTTFIRLLCGAYHPDPADRQEPEQVRVAGYDVLRQTEQARAQIGYLPQRFSLYEELTVMENIRFFAEVRGIPAREWRPRCEAILKFVGLDQFSSRRAGQLSGGMKQKLGLAAALVHRPSVLLLDEPTTGVDPVTRQDFWQLILRLVAETGEAGAGIAAGNAAGNAVLVSTPYMDEAARCSRVGFMRRGQLLIEGTPEELRQQLAGRILELAGNPLALLRQAAQEDSCVENVQMFGDRLHLRVQPGEAEAVIPRLSLKIVTLGGQVTRIRPVQAQLEDVFMHLVAENS